jgi:hypothetical protein
MLARNFRTSSLNCVAVFVALAACSSIAHATSASNALRSGRYSSATLCTASVVSGAHTMTVTLNSCDRSINGIRFTLEESADGTFESQGMQLEVWGPTTAMITAYGVGQVVFERD